MPYSTIGELPQEIQSQYDTAQQEAFLGAFNSALNDDLDESSAFAIAHDVAQNVKAFLMFKTVGNQWIGFYTNAYKDRDGEYFPESEIERDIKRMNETGELPPLLYAHIPWAVIGQTKACFKAGRFGVALGEWLDDPFSQAFKGMIENNPDYGMSFGFEYLPEQKQDNAFYGFRTFEVSVLPLEDAANSFTQFITKGVDMTPQSDATQVIRKLLQNAGIGDELATQFIQERLQQAGKSATQVADSATQRDFKEFPPMIAEEEGAEDKLEVEIEPSMKAYMDKRMMEMENKMADTIKTLMADYETKMAAAMQKPVEQKPDESIKQLQEAIKQLQVEQQAKSMQGWRADTLLNEQDETTQSNYKALQNEGFDVAFYNWSTNGTRS